MKQTFKIGTRTSPLALWQANHVRDCLLELHPENRFEIVMIQTTGDQVRDTALSMIGSRGLFTKEIERALLDNEVDIAVHSLKDLPTILPDALAIAAILEREDPRDALVAKNANAIASLPQGATIVTSSLRRRAQLMHLRSDLQIADIRGNVGTRLKKFDESNWDGIILARAGLLRLKLEGRISCTLNFSEMLPAVGQGALAIQIRSEDNATRKIVEHLDHSPTHLAVTAERAFLHAIEGGCQIPAGAFCNLEEDKLSLEAMIASPDGLCFVRDSLTGHKNDAEEIGNRLAEKLLLAGGRQILEKIRHG